MKHYISLTFPKKNFNSVDRTNIIETIENLFKSYNSKFVFISGEKGIGKTELLRQFCLKNNKNSVSLFLDPTDSSTVDSFFIKYELSNQINWLISKEELTEEELDLTFLRRTQIGLRRYLKQEKDSKLYFVIDGLDEIEQNYIYQINDILQELPLGAQDVFVLMSGSEKKLKDILKNKKYFYKEIPLNPFSIPEVKEYILQNDKSLIEHINEIYKITKGIPERLESIRRLKLLGRNIDDILHDTNDEEIIESLYSMEWKDVDFENEMQIKVLSFLAFDNKKLHTEMLSTLLNEDKDKIEKSIENLSFIKIDNEYSKYYLSFVNDAFKSFTRNKLKQNEKFVLDTLIEFYLKDLNGESILSLSNLFERTSEWDRLLNLMTQENYVNLLEKSQSIDTLIQQCDKAIIAAKTIASLEDQFKFSLYKSILLEFEKNNIWTSEIEARIELGDHNSAVNLAQSAFLLEDRLKLLALTAKKFKENKLVTSPEIIEKIRELYTKVNFEVLGEDIIDLASNLMYSCPDLAINLVEKSKLGAEGGNALDWALASLAIESLKTGAKEEKESFADDIYLKIKDKKIKDLIRGISFFTDRNSVSDINEIVKILESPNEKLFLLRSWLRLSKEKDDTEAIVRLALRIVIESAEFVPNASVMRDLAITLPNIKDKEALRELLDGFNSLNESIKQKGPTKDYVALNLLLAEAQLTYSTDDSIYRLYEIDYYVNEIQDTLTRTDVLSLFLRKIIKLSDKNENIKAAISIETISKALNEDVNKLLRDCAFQYDALKGLIRNLALINESYAEVAFSIALRLNTVISRDSALLHLFDNYISTDTQKLNFIFINKIFKNIYYECNRSTFIIELLDFFKKNSEKQKSFINGIEEYIDKIDIITDNLEKCYALVRAYLILKRNPSDTQEKLLFIKDLLQKTWDSIDPAWERVEIAYKISSDLAKEDDLLAKEYLEIAKREKSKSHTVSPETAALFISTLKLAVRAFTGLGATSLLQEVNISKLKSYIDQIPSLVDKLLLWGDCALRLKKRKEDTLFNKVVENEIKPNLKGIKDFLPGNKSDILIKISPVLFLYHSDNALDIIDNDIHSEYKDFAYDRIIEFIFTKCSTDDPCEEDYKCKKLTIEEASDCCKLLERTKTDSIIYKNVKGLCDIICYGENNFTREQINSIVTRLSNIYNNNLPDKLNIKHDGYKIVIKAQLLRLERAKYDKWEKLLIEAKSIPNLSDRIIIQYEILEALSKTHSKYEMPKKDIIQDTVQCLETLPVFHERIERYSGLLNVLRIIDRKTFEMQLRELFSKVVGSTDQSLLDAQKKLIDYAYQLDPKIAESLVSNIDTDPARGRLGINLTNHYNLLKLRSEVFENKETDNNHISDVSFMLLQSLNSGKLHTKNFEELRNFIEAISLFSFSKSLPISTYFIQNAVIRYQLTSHADVAIKKIFEATLFSANIIGYLSRKYSNTSIKYIPTLTNLTPENNIFTDGERDKAMDFLKNWLQSISYNKIDICDPYFDINDLELLKMFSSITNNFEISILTGMKHNRCFMDSNKNEIDLESNWKNISIEKPPQTKVVLVGKESNYEPPFHDRWWIFNEGEYGLRVGTSFNSIGIKKDSEISILKESEAKSIYQKIIIEYGLKNKRYYENEKLIYKIYVL